MLELQAGLSSSGVECASVSGGIKLETPPLSLHFGWWRIMKCSNQIWCVCVCKDGLDVEDSDKMLAGAHFNDAFPPSFCWDHQLIRKAWFTAEAWKETPKHSGIWVGVGWLRVEFGHHYWNYEGKPKDLGESQTVWQRLSQSPLIRTVGFKDPGHP